MKKFKRIMALVIALAMVLGLMSLSAWAEPTVNTHTVTIDNTDQNVSHSYEVYQVFVGNLNKEENTLSDIQWGSGVDGTGLLAALKASTDPALKGDDPLTETVETDANIFTSCQTAQDVAKVIATLSTTANFSTQTTDDDHGDANHGHLDGRTENAGALDLVAKIIAGDTNDSTNFPGYLTNKADAATAGDKASAFTESDGQYTANVLGDGYYIIVDKTENDELVDDTNGATKSDTRARYMLTLIRDEVIYAKDTGLSPDKKILDAVDGVATTTKVAADSSAIGDTVTFNVDVEVPNTVKYDDHFWFVMKDKLPEGITFTGNVVITVNNMTLVDLGKTSNPPNFANYDGSDYGYYTLKLAGKDVTTTTTDSYTAPTATNGSYPFEVSTYDAVKEEGGQQIEITFKEFKKFVEKNNLVGKTITIQYTGVVNDDADYAPTGNENEVTFDYSNDPNHDYDGDNPGPNDDNVTGTTPESKTKTYTTSLKIYKVDQNDNKLSGATFELKGTALNRTVLTGFKFVSADYTPANGEEIEDTPSYWKLKDGSYTTTDPATLANTTQYDSTTQKYYKVTYDYDEVAAKEVDTIIVTDGNGIAQFTGLREGTYYLEEIAAPDGYNKIDGVSVITVTWTDPEGEKPATMSDDDWAAAQAQGGFIVTEQAAGENLTGDYAGKKSYEFGFEWNNADKANNGKLFDATIQNQSGSVLPSTGGIGTTIFYVVGAILVIGAGVVLITRRRMDA